MPLYHISCREYEDDFTLPVRAESSGFQNRSEASGLGWINDVLETGAPDGVPPRSKAYYAFESIGQCLHYFSKNVCEGGGPFIYEVELTNEISAPMVVTDLLRKVGEDSDFVQRIVDEYWNSAKHWNVIEHLGDSMKIIERQENYSPGSKISAGDKYMDDISTRSSFLRELESNG